MSRLEPDLTFSMLPTWLLKSGMSDKAMRVYLVLANRADRQTGQTWPGRSLIAKESECSLRTVDRALEELIGLGAISKRQRPVDGSYFQSSIYTVHKMPPETRVTDGTARVTGDADPCHGWRIELEPRTHNADAEPEGGSPDGRSTYARQLLERLSQDGVEVEASGDRDEAYRNLLRAGMTAYPEERGLAKKVIGDYLTACEVRMDGRGWGMLGRLLKSKQPMSVFEAVVQAVDWGAGTGDYADDPASFAKYVTAILSGKGKR